MKNIHASIALTAALALALSGCAAHQPAPAPSAPAPPAASTMPVATHTQPALPASETEIAAAMPADTGKDITVQACGGCHSLARVVRQHQTRAQWQDTLSSMQDNGLEATPAELASILDYLVKHYGPAKP